MPNGQDEWVWMAHPDIEQRMRCLAVRGLAP